MLRAATSQPQPIRIVLADSSRMGNQLVSSAIRRDRRFSLVGQAVNTTELLAAVTIGCNVVILAADFERESGGLEVTRKLRDLQPQVRVVLLVDELQQETVIAVFRAGAQAIFARSESLDLLWKCIVCVNAGQIWAGTRELQFVLQAFQQSIPPRLLNERGLSLLSEQEEKVVRYVCENLSNREIAARMGLSEHTVKNHLFRIFSRLGISSRVEIMFSVLSQRVVRTPRPQEEGPPSEAALFEVYLKDAEQSPLAQFIVAQMYLEGRGTRKDLATGYMWLTVAEQNLQELVRNCNSLKCEIAQQMNTEDRKDAELLAATRRRELSSASDIRRPASVGASELNSARVASESSGGFCRRRKRSLVPASTIDISKASGASLA